MKIGFWDYVRAAFNARPAGMWVPPNWIGVGLFALLGLLNGGLWLLGAGLELGYLYTLANNRRFQNLVLGMGLDQQRRQWEQRQQRLVAQLSGEDQQGHTALEGRCKAILAQQQALAGPAGLQAQSEGLGRLLWIHLRLLLTRQSIQRVLREATPAERGKSLESRAADLQNRLKDESLNAELRKSLAGQEEIIQQRLQKRGEARDKLAFVEAELTRIAEQVELIREQAAVTADSQTVSQRIDEIAATLGGTTQWIQQQQQIYGQVEDLLSEPPAVPMPPAVEEQQT